MYDNIYIIDHDINGSALDKPVQVYDNDKKFRIVYNQPHYKRDVLIHTEPKIIKNIITECYCKHIPENKNKEVYEEMANLLGIYAYTKDKINIKPYIIIGKNL